MNTLYVNNTKADFSNFHSVIVEAINNGGEFSEDFSDILKLTNFGAINDDGSNRWGVDFI